LAVAAGGIDHHEVFDAAPFPRRLAAGTNVENGGSGFAGTSPPTVAGVHQWQPLCKAAGPLVRRQRQDKGGAGTSHDNHGVLGNGRFG
jgi:hypothetical protein